MGASQRLTDGPVLVGVDGSAGARVAVDIGAWEAKWRHVPLLLVHGHQNPLPHTSSGVLPQPAVAAMRDDMRAMLLETESRAHAQQPGVAVRSTLVTGGAGGLVEVSRGMSLVVVGSRGTGGFAGLHVGSVASQVSMHSPAPVIVVRPGKDGSHARIGDGPVVVGLDGSQPSFDALGFAFEEANVRGVPLVPLYAWSQGPNASSGYIGPIAQGPGRVREEIAQTLVEEFAAPWQEKYPDVRVTPIVRYQAPPAWALIEASRQAGLVVVGSRGRGGFAGLLLGSVGHAVASHAHCPVAVVRAAGD